MSNLISNKGDCRTVPDTPGLLIIFNKLYIYTYLLKKKKRMIPWLGLYNIALSGAHSFTNTEYILISIIPLY